MEDRMIERGQDYELLQELQELVGTWADVARACGVSSQALHYWRLRERIPPQRKVFVQQLVSKMKAARAAVHANI